MDRRNTRTPLARAAGLGSSKSGVEHWLAQRVSAVALIPLTLWLVTSIIAHSGSDHVAFLAWLSAPHTSLLMILLLTALFHHIAHGLQVVIEDYMHDGAKFAGVLLLRVSCFALAAAGILATLHIAIHG